jgi:aminopeptidase N
MNAYPMLQAICASLLFTVFAAGCATPPPPAVDAVDIHSYARPAEARVTHVALDLSADFQAKILAGTAALDIEAAPSALEIVLDTKNLDVQSVQAGDGSPLSWRYGPSDQNLGAPLIVTLPERGVGRRKITVAYATRPEAAALQWLTPEQTADKRHPYLFSQGQAILTRTWIPTQDSPGIRQSYTARIVTPEALTAVMSAEMKTPEGEPAGPGRRAFRFALDQPVPPYLIAIAIGDIAFRPLGPRSGVYAEPSVVDRAAAEFADVERMMDAAEALYGPYRWGRYDLLVLPPSFPFGGMENPRLTFATPTILAGDKSLVSLVAHELAHSWSGNLVTNATWADFWINEGFTSYFEYRIMEELYGERRAGMLRTLGWRELTDEITSLGGPTSADTKLHLDLAGRDPDDGMTYIAYEKGANFLRTIEQAVGRERFDTWLRSYFDRFAFQPMTAERFLADLRARLIRGDSELERLIMAEAWVYEPGLPPVAQAPTSDAFAAVDLQAQAFAAGAPAASLKTADWTTQEWQHFLGALPQTLPAESLADLDATLDLSNAGNSEILFGWLKLAVNNRYEPAVPALERFLISQGRRKFVAPLFQALVAQGEWGRPIAVRVFARARGGYHAVTASAVAAALSEQ